jgi:hypothetical protein
MMVVTMVMVAMAMAAMAMATVVVTMAMSVQQTRPYLGTVFLVGDVPLELVLQRLLVDGHVQLYTPTNHQWSKLS